MWYDDSVGEREVDALLFFNIQKQFFRSRVIGGGQPDVERISTSVVVRTTPYLKTPYMMDICVYLKLNQRISIQYAIYSGVGYHKSVLYHVSTYGMILVLE